MWRDQPCRLATKHVREDGYAWVYEKGRHGVLAHRLAWEGAYGPIPKGLQVQHLCDADYPPGDITNRRCTEPTHLQLGTPHENNLHMVDTGRAPHGKLSRWEVLTIRALFRTGQINPRELAEAFGIPRPTAYNIVAGRTWSALQ